MTVRGRRLTAPVAAPFLFASVAFAQNANPGEISFVVSTTAAAGQVALGLPALTDGDLLRVESGATPRPWLLAGNWRATLGFDPGDVDAFAWRPGAAATSAASIAFSTLSNVGPYLDGDVLGLGPDGSVEIVFAEDDLAFGLGLPGTAIDVDALAFDGGGRLLFSLQSDLDGTLLGTVANGDVLRLETDGSVSRVVSEQEVESALAAATGASGAVGDVHGVDWVAGEIWVLVQSPGDVDGGVLAVGPAARLVADEGGLGLGGEELDALASLPAGTGEIPALWIHDAGFGPVGVVEGGTPGGVGLALATSVGGHSTLPGLGGIGAFFIDPGDPLLASQLEFGPTLFTFDGAGRYEAPVGLPLSGAGSAPDGSLGWTFQVLDLTSIALTPAFRADA